MEGVIGFIIGGVIGFFFGRESGERRTFTWMDNAMNYFNYSDERREIVEECQRDMGRMDRDFKEGKDEHLEHQKKKK